MLKAAETILRVTEKENISIVQAILKLSSTDTGVSEAEIRGKMHDRLLAIFESVEDAAANTEPLKFGQIPELNFSSDALSGEFILYASKTAIQVSKHNATMGRVVAAPTAGSCGILPGIFSAWKTLRAGDDWEEQLTDALIVAGAIGEVIAKRATLAGAEGGCQAECGAASAMGSAALAFLRGGSCETCLHAAALTIKSLLGLACDPVGGIVECPCIKRNGMLVANAILAADLALASVRSLIPLDEVIDTMKEIGQMLPPAIRETSLGGLAQTPSGIALTKKLHEGE